MGTGSIATTLLSDNWGSFQIELSGQSPATLKVQMRHRGPPVPVPEDKLPKALKLKGQSKMKPVQEHEEKEVDPEMIAPRNEPRSQGPVATSPLQSDSPADCLPSSGMEPSAPAPSCPDPEQAAEPLAGSGLRLLKSIIIMGNHYP